MSNQAEIDFTQWRAANVPFETEPFPPTPQNPRRTAPDDDVNEPTQASERATLNSNATPLDKDGTIHFLTTGGIAASQPEVRLAKALVAPATFGNELNTIMNSVVPLACWRAHDMRFEIESSFVRPEISTEIIALKELIDRHTLTGVQGEPEQRPALTVFGHADPSGDDDFNKALSGRRAMALYALLTRKVGIWEHLHSNPLHNDKWNPKALVTMQVTLGQAPTANLSAGERAALFKSYMDHVCTARNEDGELMLDDAGSPIALKLKASDFLAGGKDHGGKGDFQGCSEFNPILMFSAAENKLFSQAQRKSERDAQNAPNRRVLIFLFRPGVRINPNIWPCPRVTEGTGECRKRFFSDAAKRRSFQEKRREFKDDRDTFACRFYDRLSNSSPCELGLTTIRIRLYDPAGKNIPGAPFDVQVGLRKPTPLSKADETGLIVVHDLEVPNRCIVRWGFPPEKEGEKPELIFTLDMFLTHENLSRREEAIQKLHNLGYDKQNDATENIGAFQRDYGRLASPPLEFADGLLDDQTMKLLRAVYAECAIDLRNTPPKP